MSWNKSSSAPQPPPRKSVPPSLKRGLLAGLLVVALGALCLYLFSNGEADSRPLQKKDRGRIKEVTPAAAPKAVEESLKPDPPEKKESLRAKLAKMTPQERAKAMVKQAVETPLPNFTNRTYSTQTEMFMDWIFTKELGDQPVPLPSIPLNELAHMDEILSREIEIKENDSEAIAASKEQVALVKKELKKFLDEGGQAQDFLQYYHDELQNAYLQREEANRQVMEVLRNEPDLIADYLHQVNQSLGEKGIRKISLGGRLLKRYGLTEADLKIEGDNSEGQQPEGEQAK